MLIGAAGIIIGSIFFFIITKYWQRSDENSFQGIVTTLQKRKQMFEYVIVDVRDAIISYNRSLFSLCFVSCDQWAHYKSHLLMEHFALDIVIDSIFFLSVIMTMQFGMRQHVTGDAHCSYWNLDKIHRKVYCIKTSKSFSSQRCKER